MERLIEILRRIDGRGYKAWQDIRGHFEMDRCSLFVDHVQGDPFAAPSKMRLRVPQRRARIPAALYDGSVRRIALADYLARRAAEACRAQSERRGSGKSGAIFIDAGGQEVLQRTAVVVDPEWVEARLEVGLPAAGRRVLGREGEELLCHALPAIAANALMMGALSEPAVRFFVECVENQEAIRNRRRRESAADAAGGVTIKGDLSQIIPRENRTRRTRSKRSGGCEAAV